MADLDPELLDRAVRWCAEAGRHVGAAEVRRALARLGWDELLAVRALLADPPPARPLGPHALADLARGAPPDVAAEREREGRYRSEAEADDADPAATVAPAAAAPARGRRRGRGPGVLIRRARDRASSPSVAPPPLPDVDELRRPEGRAVLERLMRHHGARRAPIVAALAAGWSGGSDGRPGDAELSALLDHHGLARAFERRERDEVLHALRAAGGVRSAAAERLGLDPDGLAPVLARLRATEQAERIREDRRSELRGRATLAERVRLLLSDEARLRDLDVLEEFEADLRARLPEHLRALRAGAEPLAVSLARSLALSRADAQALAARFALDLGPASAPSARAAHGRKGPRSPAPGARAGGARLGAGTRRGAAPPAGGRRVGRQRPAAGGARTPAARSSAPRAAGTPGPRRPRPPGGPRARNGGRRG